MSKFKLVDKATGEPVNVGDKRVTFDGEKVVVKHLSPPRHPGSSGHVDTTGGYWYPSVIGAKYIVEG